MAKMTICTYSTQDNIFGVLDFQTGGGNAGGITVAANSIAVMRFDRTALSSSDD